MARRARRRPEWRTRSARTPDALAMAAIYNAAVRSTIATFDTAPRSLGEQRRWLAHHGPRHPVLVADTEGTVVGWASLSAWSDRCAYEGTAEVSVYVREDWRGRGVGRALLEALVARARRIGLHTLLARIAVPNPVSAHLHRAFGFRSVGVMREVGFKFDRWIDVELFQLLIRPRPTDSIPRARIRRSVRTPRAGAGSTLSGVT